MPSEVILPRVDMDMTTGKIAKWFVELGAKVTKGQPLFEIETDKAAMEIEAPVSGTICDLASASGADVPVGSVVAWIFAEGEAVSAAAVLQPLAPVASRRDAEDLAFDSALPLASSEAPAAEMTGRTGTDDPDRPRATPMARRLAREAGLDLSAVTGSGPRGRIQAGDVISAIGRTAVSTAGAPAAPHASMAAAQRSAPAVPRASSAVHLVRLREGEGRPTLTIHGFGADVNNWRPYLAGVGSGRPVVALDLPGHGASPLGAVADFETLVDAVEVGLVGGGLGAVDLVGHSLGSAVAAALAARGTLDCRSLLLLSPAGLGPDINGDFLRGFLRATTEAALTPWMHQLVAEPAAITPVFVRATIRARQGTSLVADQQRLARAIFPDDTQAFSIRADLARLTIPVRVVVGAADAIIPARHSHALPPLVALHRLPGIGHMPHIEARERVLAIQRQMSGAPF